MQKRLNRSRCRLGAESFGSKEEIIRWGQDRTNPLAAARDDKSAIWTFVYLYLCGNLLNAVVYRMAISLVYYGLTLSAGELAGNRYVNIFLSGMAEIPAYLFSFFMLQK